MPLRAAAPMTVALLLGLGACTPTVRVQVAPINIYAKLDANVRLQLDKEVQTLLKQRPDLF
jgi:hypothetical protein